MKLIMLISALILLASISTSRATVYIATDQQVNFRATNSDSYYWAMIYDYTFGFIESDTGGFINTDTALEYETDYDQIHVAYIYDEEDGRYTGALALRDIEL